MDSNTEKVDKMEKDLVVVFYILSFINKMAIKYCSEETILEIISKNNNIYLSNAHFFFIRKLFFAWAAIFLT